MITDTTIRAKDPTQMNVKRNIFLHKGQIDANGIYDYYVGRSIRGVKRNTETSKKTANMGILIVIH